VRKPDVEGRFIEIMQNHGYPWAEAFVEADIDSLAKRADVKVIVRPGPKSYFTNFYFEGIESVPERIVRREMEIERGEVYDKRKIQEAQRQIFGHHLFRFATITLPEQERDSTLDLRRSGSGSIRCALCRPPLEWAAKNTCGGSCPGSIAI
jgi:outer membrane protein insertion porin family